jgi:two-component SAPR family response regulator
MEGRQLQGVLLVDYGGAVPDPITRNAVQLMAMIRDTTGRLEPPISLPPSSVQAEVGPELRLRCFGKLEIRVGDQVVATDSFTRKKALTLLKLLVLRRGNPVSRDALIEHLWPGVDDKAGTNRLHGVVHALRSGIEPFRDKKRWLFVRNQGDLYYFDTESPHWVDVFAFRRLAAMARDLERRGDEELAISRLEEAAALYRGNLFEDEPYADWCALERDELRGTYLDVVRHLARLCSKTGNPESAVAHLRRGLIVDRLREDLHQMLIETLIGLGRRRDALDQYRECARLLREEIGAEPLPATRRLERLVTAEGRPA